MASPSRAAARLAELFQISLKLCHWYFSLRPRTHGLTTIAFKPILKLYVVVLHHDVVHALFYKAFTFTKIVYAQSSESQVGYEKHSLATVLHPHPPPPTHFHLQLLVKLSSVSLCSMPILVLVNCSVFSIICYFPPWNKRV